MSELVMTTEAKWLNDFLGENSDNIIQVSESAFLQEIENKHEFLDRDLAEGNSDYKQIVSYCLIVCKDYFFITQRTSRQSEKRLHNKFSLGIGGHISSSDLLCDNVVIGGMLRELFEEVNIDCPYRYDFLGVINDNSTEVNTVHAGVCYVISLEDKKCYVNETEKMHGFWINKNDIGQYVDKLEGWSKILINSYCK